MIRTGFTFEVFAEIEFTEQEIEMLTACSTAHYDLKCRKLSQPGGFLYGLQSMFRMLKEDPKKARWNLSSRDLDMLCKVVENPRDRTEFWKRLERDLHDQRRNVAAKRETLR